MTQRTFERYEDSRWAMYTGTTDRARVDSGRPECHRIACHAHASDAACA
jgi:hypothetical protein